jgi:putative ABC transport system permease protein
MLAYHLRIAAKSLRRTPVLSSLLVAGIALGIAVSTAFVAAYHTIAKDPIPDRSDKLYYVELDAWNPQRPYDQDHPSYAPDQLTWRDAKAIQASTIPTYRAAMFKGELTVFPARAQERPFRAVTRMTYGDFFAMFHPPFRYGSGWSKDADSKPEAVVVLDDATNEKLFGGQNSVGQRVRIEDRDFTVAGVLAPWYPEPKFYDPLNGAFNTPEAIYIPYRWTEPMKVDSAGNTNGWKGSGDTFADKVESEATWIQYWVQLDTPQQKEAYQTFLDGYAAEQKKLGRFGRPINNQLLPVMEFLRQEEVVPREAKTMLVISLLFLVVSAVNLIGILLGKFLARSPEVGVRRALGASRGHVFLQHLLECELVATVGGLLGIAASVAVLHAYEKLQLIGTTTPRPTMFHLEPSMMGAGLVLALLAGLVAGVYPAWRICRIAPANHLKQQ